MKRILYFDASAGVSGDMFVGALLDLGVSLEQIRSHVASLGVEGIELRARRVASRGIAGTKFDVLDPASGRPVDDPEGRHHHDHGHGHHHDHGHDHNHGHSHDHEHHHPRAHDHPHEHADQPGVTHEEARSHGGAAHGEGHGEHHEQRGLREIRRLIRGSRLPGPVADDAMAVFELLAEAEAHVHGTSPDEVHFHEVGALDSIGDIVAAASAFHQVAPGETWCSAIHVGSGTVRCAHGLLPVPAPATLELLKGLPAYSDGTRGELATPTGVALLRHFCTGFGPMPPFVVEAVGHGAGSKDYGIPNLFRATVGTTAAKAVAWRGAAASR